MATMLLGDSFRVELYAGGVSLRFNGPKILNTCRPQEYTLSAGTRRQGPDDKSEARPALR